MCSKSVTIEMMAKFFEDNPAAMLQYTSIDDGVYLTVGDEKIHLGFGGDVAAQALRGLAKKVQNNIKHG